jgi:hypothetical protein
VTHIEVFLAARRTGCPLVMIQTPDQAVTIREIRKALLDKFKKTASKTRLIVWDCVRGYWPESDPEDKARWAAEITAINTVTAESDPDAVRNKSVNASEAVELAAKFDKQTILFLMNAQVGFEPPNPNFIQAVWNLRDIYKQRDCQLVMLTPGCKLPPELAQDVLTIDEALPTPEQLQAVVESCFKATDSPVPDGIMPKAVDALCGLAAFPAEQVTAMSLYRNEDKIVTVNLDSLWSRKRQIIEQAPGLNVWRGGERFADIGGLDNAKNFYSRILSGKKPPNAIVWLDEAEKMFAGATSGTSDTSGVSQGFMGTILSEMQNYNYTGSIAVGVPGCAKSMFAKAIGNEAGIPTIGLDLSSLKGSLVGESENNLRRVLKIIRAISNGNALWFATSNKASILPPELRRRFTFGLMFFDLPTKDERAMIWKLYLDLYQIEDRTLPDDDLWTGAEIRTCCDLAWRMARPLVEVAQYISPVAKTAPEQVAELRRQADGKYISAAYPGFYHYAESQTISAAARLISLDDEEAE